MKYLELVKNINELLYITTQDKINISAYLIIFIQKINELNNPYKDEAMEEFIDFIRVNLISVTKDQTILNESLKQMEDIKGKHSIDYLEYQDIYPLYVKMVERINNSIVVRRLYIDKVVNAYFRLLMFNGFTSNNFYIEKNNEYINEDEYNNMIKVLELKKEI